MHCNECGEEFEIGQRMVGITGGNSVTSEFFEGPTFIPDQDEDYIALYHSGDRDCWDTVSSRIWPSPVRAH